MQRKTTIKYNTNSQAYTALIEDNRGNMLGLGYGNSKKHALKMAKLEASGKFTSEGRVAKVTVAI